MSAVENGLKTDLTETGVTRYILHHVLRIHSETCVCGEVFVVLSVTGDVRVFI